jgi:hypothetical protein
METDLLEIVIVEDVSVETDLREIVVDDVKSFNLTTQKTNSKKYKYISLRRNGIFGLIFVILVNMLKK